MGVRIVRAYIETIAQVATALGILLAAVTLKNDIDKAAGRRENDCIRRWQRVAVHHMLIDALPEAIGFEDIRQRYTSSAAASPECDIPKKELQPDALSDLLLQLQSKHAVAVTEDRKWIAVVIPPGMTPAGWKGSAECQQMGQASDFILATVQTDPCRYDQQQLASLIARAKINVPAERVPVLIANLAAMGVVKIDAHGRVCLGR
jgi:hypothetical protein